jgi:hypothetical protein
VELLTKGEFEIEVKTGTYDILSLYFKIAEIKQKIFKKKTPAFSLISLDEDAN